MAAGALTACAVLVLSLFLPAWLSALIVGAVLGCGGVSCSPCVARSRSAKAGALIPEQTIETIEGGRGMGQDPSDIRAEIEETRARVGDEVDALSYKTDVPARVGDYVDEKKQAVKDKVTGAKDAITGYSLGRRAERPPDRQAQGHGRAKPTRAGRRRGSDRASSPGCSFPRHASRTEQMGEMSDRVVDAAKDTAGEALESGKQVAQEAADSATEQGQELASSLQERAQDSLGGTRNTA